MCSVSHAGTQAELRRAASPCGSMMEVVVLQSQSVGENTFPVFCIHVFHQVCKESFLLF